ncbi:vacuolar protein sorting-associated protein 52 homolog [Eurytemora carolleeae]|uniref:vacuolar protein sorting-associated protein 52 homolog n=1 Tax=Eurytemora carolleeae TaxID=1294199 RepID=UPI000C77FEAB|nr:vacuolar protein sorting-associated protein 52 homolog [Eurytemora carolleeae]|eukprot:XP_023342298.1 vacuolar protein sorting-associated protein 52 homolog [Eurytemora affinis]
MNISLLHVLDRMESKDEELQEESIQGHLQDEIIKEALSSGLDLREYSKKVEKELESAEHASIGDYIAESGNIAALHNQISSCDGILARMEGLLTAFQTDLGSISNEILSLQQQSVEMNLRLKNRQAVRGELSQFVDDMVVTEQMISTILEVPVTETQFYEQLHILNHKIAFLNEQSFRDAKSCVDVKDVIEKLKIKAVAKIREYFMLKINQFKKPLTNYQIPQSGILKFKFYFQFLQAVNREVAKEIRDEYTDTMSKILFSYFKSYTGRLSKLQFEESASRDDLLGAEETSSKGFFFKPSLKNKSTVFSVGCRDDVLNSQLEAPIIVPHAQLKNEMKYPFEMIFRSVQYTLVDNGCREFLFLSELFLVDGQNAQDLFNFVFGKTLQILIKFTDTYVQDSYDSIAVFLCIHLVQRYQLLCHKRCVPGLDKYWDTMNGILWPRLTQLLELNTQSVRDCDVSRIKPTDVRPHFITRRYAEYSAGIVGINESFPHEHMHKLLAYLQEEVESLILRLAGTFPARKDQLLFLINNYDVIMSIILERTKEETKESDAFREQLRSRSEEFVEQILQAHFGYLIQWINEAERKLEKGDIDGLKQEEKKVSQIISTFGAEWKKSLDRINGETLSSFPNLKLGTGILQQTLTTLLQYYHRFTRLMSVAPLSQTPAASNLINIHQLMVEVKKYKPNF